MAVGKRCNAVSEYPQFVEKCLDFAHNTRILGRKRVVLSNGIDASNLSSPLSTQLRVRRSRRGRAEQLNRLVSLPQDVLVRVLSKVDHSDLKQLLLVSKFVKETALIARELHFKYSTPSSKHIFYKDCNSGSEDGGEKTPNAPVQHRVARSRIDCGRLASLAVNLFAVPEAQWPGKDSSTEM